MKTTLLFCVLLAGVSSQAPAQERVDSLVHHADTTVQHLSQLPPRYFSKVDAKADRLNGQLSRRTEKALRRLQTQEEKINHKLSKIDSVAAHNLFSTSLVRMDSFGDSLSHLQDLVKGKITKVTAKIPGGQYIPYLDSLQTSLNFLNKYSSQLNEVKGIEQ